MGADTSLKYEGPESMQSLLVLPEASSQSGERLMGLQGPRAMGVVRMLERSREILRNYVIHLTSHLQLIKPHMGPG